MKKGSFQHRIFWVLNSLFVLTVYVLLFTFVRTCGNLHLMIFKLHGKQQSAVSQSVKNKNWRLNQGKVVLHIFAILIILVCLPQKVAISPTFQVRPLILGDGCLSSREVLFSVIIMNPLNLSRNLAEFSKCQSRRTVTDLSSPHIFSLIEAELKARKLTAIRYSKDRGNLTWTKPLSAEAFHLG